MVEVLTEKNNEFEELYIRIRDLENRVLSDEQVLSLPFLKNHPHQKEWKKRQRTVAHFKEYLTEKKPKTILDLGCGNGWFTHFLSTNCNGSTIIGIDVNETELTQADKLFGSENVKFAYADIFKIENLNNKFDLIVLNASVQYFPHLPALIEKLMGWLNEEGQIHILDSAFYKCQLIEEARERSVQYYESQGIKEMADYYHHHCWDDLKPFCYRINYVPPVYCQWLTKIGFRIYSPFPWISIHKTVPEN